MYEDRTYENLMAERMEDAPDGLFTGEGSLFYAANAEGATREEAQYTQMSRIERNLFFDTADVEHLIGAYGFFIDYHYATKAVVRGVFQQEIEIGTRFTVGDMDFVATEFLEGYTYSLTCETAGRSGNIQTGNLEPIDYVEDWQGGTVSGILIPGTADEEEEHYRERIRESFSAKPFAGNKKAYRDYVDELVPGTHCIVNRRARDSEYIVIQILDSDYGIPSAALLHTLQSGIDPEENQGEGEGMAGINQKVQVVAAGELDITVGLSLELDTGYGYEDVETQIQNAIEGYLLGIRQQWESGETLVVRKVSMEAAIVAIEGVLDITALTLNPKYRNLVTCLRMIMPQNRTYP